LPQELVRHSIALRDPRRVKFLGILDVGIGLVSRSLAQILPPISWPAGADSEGDED
jgi:hypothetical protein